MLPGIVLSILVCCLWGLGDYYLGRSGVERNIHLTNFVQSLVGVLATAPFVIAYGLEASVGAFFILILISFLSSSAFLCYIKAFSSGPFGVVAPVANSYPMITLVIGVYLLGAPISDSQILALLVIISGVITLSVERGISPGEHLKNRTFNLALLTALGWGAGYALFDLVVDELKWFEIYFLLAIFQSLFAFVYYVLFNRSLPGLSQMSYRYSFRAWNAGILLAAGFGFFFLAIDFTGSVVVPAVIASASPLATCLLAYQKDGEVPGLSKKFGAVIIVLGIMALNF